MTMVAELNCEYLNRSPDSSVMSHIADVQQMAYGMLIIHPVGKQW